MLQRFDRGLSIAFGSAAALAVVAAVGSWRDNNPSLADFADGVPSGKSARFYARVHDLAAREGNFPLALDAAAAEIKSAPRKAAAWQRLSFAETAVQGAPTQAALAALLKSYELAPYPAPADIRWRVEFAHRYWAAMPDIIQTKTLTQIAALRDVPETWRVREQWCQTFDAAPALKQAACVISSPPAQGR